LIFGYYMCLASFIGTTILIIMDVRADNDYELQIDTEEKSHRSVKEKDEYTLWVRFKNLGLLFWLINMITIILYATIVCFVSISVAYFHELYFTKRSIKTAQNYAGMYISIPYLMGAVLIPIVGNY